MAFASGLLVYLDEGAAGKSALSREGRYYGWTTPSTKIGAISHDRGDGLPSVGLGGQRPGAINPCTPPRHPAAKCKGWPLVPCGPQGRGGAAALAWPSAGTCAVTGGSVATVRAELMLNGGGERFLPGLRTYFRPVPSTVFETTSVFICAVIRF